MILKKWHQGLVCRRIVVNNANMDKISFFALKILDMNKAASLVCKNFVINMATMIEERLAYARCFVQVSTANPLKHTVYVDVARGKLDEINVESEWTPFGSGMYFFCHMNENCSHG